MVALKYKIIHDGKPFVIRDWLVQGFAKNKVASIAASMDSADELTDGTFRLSAKIGQRCRLRLGTENHQVYGWCNRIEAYLAEGWGTGAVIEGEEQY